MKKIQPKNIAQIEADKELAKVMQGEAKGAAQLAFNQLWKRYKSPILYYILRLVGNDQELAKDLRQEVFSKVFVNIKQYDFSSALTTWMYHIAKNVFIDYKRTHKCEIMSIETLKSNFSSIDGETDSTEFYFQLIDSNDNSLDGLIKNEMAKAVQETLANIKDEHTKKIIMLYFLEQKSLDEVTNEIGLPLNTVKTRLYRGLESMKTIISSKIEFGRVLPVNPFKKVEENDEVEFVEFAEQRLEDQY